MPLHKKRVFRIIPLGIREQANHSMTKPYRVINAFHWHVGRPRDGESIFSNNKLVNVDDKSDEALQDHRGK